MRLSHIVASQISKATRSRGQSYFDSGAVHALTTHDGIIEATVMGSELYAVRLEPSADALSGSCTCPYFFDRLEICKHIWAVILAAEARSLPLVPAGMPLETIDLAPIYPDEDPIDGDDLLDDDWLQDQAFAERMKASRRQLRRSPGHYEPFLSPSRPAVRPEWRILLDEVAAKTSISLDSRPRLTPGQLLFVVDLAASEHSHNVVVELMTRDRKINGEWGKPRPARLVEHDIRTCADEGDRHILERMLGARAYFDYGGYDVFGSELARQQMHGSVVSDLMPLLCATGRCVLRTSAAYTPRSATALSAPIEWDARAPWVFTVGIRHADAGYEIEGWLTRGDERMELTNPALVVEDGIVLTHTHAAPLDAGRAFSWLAALRRAGRITVPMKSRDELIDALLASSPHLARVPEELQVETVRVEPNPQVRLRPMPQRGDRIRADLAFDYEGTIVAVGAPQRAIRSAVSTRAILRDVQSERRAVDLLYQRGCRHDDWGRETIGRVMHIASNLVPRLVRHLLDEGWHVEASGHVYRRPGAVTLNVTSGIDWFDVHGEVTYEGQHASLPALLAALDRGDAFITLDDGTRGLLPEEWLRRHALLARLGSTSGEHLRFKTSQVALLDAIIATQPNASWDETFGRARAELQAFDGIRPADPPPAFTGTLRGYQREGLGWLLFLQRFGFGGCLADDMGLGKTVMVLALLSARQALRSGDERRPSLVVAPRSLVFNWRQEAERFTPNLRVLEYVGANRPALRGTFADQDVILTTFGTLRRDAKELSTIDFDYVILDEAQAIKNASSVSAKATRVLKARHRLALSGTPIENHLGEMWSIFEFLNPGLLSTARAFDGAGGQRLDEASITLLARGLRPFILRRTKEQVASDLPAKSEQTLSCELERPQRALYDELRAHYRRTLLEGPGTNGSGRSKLQILEALLRLRQAACHPGLVDKRRAGDASAKLDVLVPRLTEAYEEGHKTLVFSQFTSLLAILRAQLDHNGTPYEYLDGRTRDRQAKVERFQSDPECRLFLISLKAGGLGLNLMAAEYVFLLDPWWNPAVESQAIDRAHRIGQSRHVFAYRLIARDTVEERVLELQERKRHLADAILTTDNSVMRDLRREDLELLLS